MQDENARLSDLRNKPSKWLLLRLLQILTV